MSIKNTKRKRDVINFCIVEVGTENVPQLQSIRKIERQTRDEEEMFGREREKGAIDAS